MSEGTSGKRKPALTFLSCLLIFLLSVNFSTVVSPLGAGVSPAGAADGGLPIFKMTLIVPAEDPVKAAMSSLIRVNLRQLGIDVQSVVLDTSQTNQRVFAPNLFTRGKSYDNGGFDAILLGYQLPVSPDPYVLYNSTQFAPNGMNYYLWNDTTNDQWSSSIRKEVNATKRLQLERSWQSYAMEWLPSTAILYANGSVVVNPSLDSDPFQTLTYPIWPAVERWSGNLTALGYTVVLAQPRNASNLIPVFSTSYYDSAVMNPVYGPAGFGLFQLTSMSPPSTYAPCMARNWTVSSDLRNWTIDVRTDIYFHDGVKLTAEDVNFTLKAYMTPILGSPLYSLFKDVFGSNSSISLGASNYTIEIRLPKPYAYIMDLLSVPILPKHILTQIPYDAWRTSPFNTGKPSSPSAYYQHPNGTQIELVGPVGAGPYRYSGYNETSQAYHLIKFGNYFNRTTLETKGAFGVNDYYVRVVSPGSTALQEFANGRVHVLDMQYHLELLGSYLSSYIGSGKFVTFNSLNVQELGFNMQHPILGTGLGTPVGTGNPSSAADAAKHVRKAIAYAIPRETIIEQLVMGYGIPGRTTSFCPQSEGYDQTIAFFAFNLTRAAEELRLAGYQPGPLTGGLWESYGTAIILVVAAAAVLVTIVVLWKTRLISKLRGEGITEKRIKQKKWQQITTTLSYLRSQSLIVAMSRILGH